MDYKIDSISDNSVDYSQNNRTIEQNTIMKPTENVVPLDQSLVILYIYTLLDDYDSAINAGKKPKIDPYRDDILIKLDNGNYALIPKDVQQYSISKWLEAKGINNDKPTVINDYKPTIIKNKKYDNSAEESYENDKDDTLVDTLFQLAFCLLIICLILYTLSLFRAGLIKLN